MRSGQVSQIPLIDNYFSSKLSGFHGFYFFNAENAEVAEKNKKGCRVNPQPFKFVIRTLLAPYQIGFP